VTYAGHLLAVLWVLPVFVGRNPKAADFLATMWAMNPPIPGSDNGAVAQRASVDLGLSTAHRRRLRREYVGRP
jgi:hypothetical protein